MIYYVIKVEYDLNDHYYDDKAFNCIDRWELKHNFGADFNEYYCESEMEDGHVIHTFEGVTLDQIDNLYFRIAKCKLKDRVKITSIVKII